MVLVKRPLSNDCEAGRLRAALLSVLILVLLLADATRAEEGVATPARAGSADFPKLAVIVELAKKGDARAQFKLGDYYYARGEFQAAVRWYDQAARQGHAVAQTALANCYAAGRGVKRDSALAAKWSRMAAHQKALPPETVQEKPVPASIPREIPGPMRARQSAVTPTAIVTPDDGVDASGPAAQTRALSARAVDGPQGTPGATLVSQMAEKRAVSPTVVPRVWTLEAPQPVIRAE